VSSPAADRSRLGLGVVHVIRFGPEDRGRRITLRATDPADGQRTVDTVGTLLEWTSDGLVVERRTGERVEVPHERVLAGRVVAPEVSAVDLQRRCAAEWTPDEQVPLGPWTLRWQRDLGRKRSASALALDLAQEPGATAALLDEVTAFYTARGTRPLVATVEGSPVDAAVAAYAWPVVLTVDVLVARVDRDTEGVAPIDAGHRIALQGEPPDRLLAVQAAKEGAAATAALQRLLRTGPPAQFAVATDGAGDAIATARCTTSGEWAGVTFMEVDAEHRGRGLATGMLARLLDAAGGSGARQAWAQVDADNAAAHGLFAGAGFVPHHRYVYRGRT
jgi:GNAT superfamily N-acetyltransferase